MTSLRDSRSGVLQLNRSFFFLVSREPVLPQLSPEQERLSKRVKTHKKRLVPLRRRKSDIVGGGARAEAMGSSNRSSSPRAPTSVGSGVASPDSSRPSTTSSPSISRERRASSGRIPNTNSDSEVGLGADQGHLKVSPGK